MGSYCSLEFDETEICFSKSIVPDHWCAVFQEADRVVKTVAGEDGIETKTVYTCPRAVFSARLDILGCSRALAMDRLEAWIVEEKSTWSDRSDWGDDWAPMATAVHAFTSEEWYRRAKNIVSTMWDDVEPIDPIDKRMRRSEGGEWLWFDGYGSLMGLRALLDACPDVKSVTLDISDLIANGWIEPDEKICEHRRNEIPLGPLPLTPTLVLAEGISDIRILQRSLRTLFPEFHEFFSFFNHSELSVDGGSNYLLKFLKAFAAARVPVKMVAIFDNDTVGRQALKQALALKLPANIMVMSLPDIDIARRYPTIGPQGEHCVDVNGSAAGIELYLGAEALMPNGSYLPVHWAGYNQSAKAYQGEVADKAGVEARFHGAIEKYGDPQLARQAFPELALVWEAILDVVRRQAEASERKSMSLQHFATDERKARLLDE